MVTPTDANDFHEGLLFDALFQMYPPNVVGGVHAAHPNSGHHVPPRLPYILPVSANATQSPASALNPYESVPVLNQLRQHNQHQQHLHHHHVASHHNQQPPPQYHRHHHNSSSYYPSPVVRGSQESFTNFRQQPQPQTGQQQQQPQKLSSSNKPPSQDSDSGYSNNTSGGRGSSGSRSKSETLQRISSHGEFPLS